MIVSCMYTACVIIPWTILSTTITDPFVVELLSKRLYIVPSVANVPVSSNFRTRVWMSFKTSIAIQVLVSDDASAHALRMEWRNKRISYWLLNIVFHVRKWRNT